MTEIHIDDVRYKIIAKLTCECILLQERNATDQDMEIWRQTVRERYPRDCNQLFLAVQKRLMKSIAC